LQRHAAFHARWRADRRNDVARVHERVRGRRRIDRRLLEKARGMPRGGHLFDALPEYAAAAHDVSDLALITIDLYGARPEKIGGGAEIEELCVHCFPFKLKWSSAARYSIKPARAISLFTAIRCSRLSAARV